ncbi:MAG: CoA-binding protein [Ignavibacteriales bacterium]|nr:CoA-binding protein [Ignavibacteriales bacterium]MCF8305258.1 CoA-binding protein [Ignavibacteriales bacterium]MCF8314829.1 CoA-binding protein [Ignavibacteriales bacterium]MCF8436222.1 CoA-binding protein [Ignavibacteriales bacterium]
MKTSEKIADFLHQDNIAVVGVSGSGKKFGDMVFKELKKSGKRVFPVNPKLNIYNGLKCFNSLDEIPQEIKTLMICTKCSKIQNFTEIMNSGRFSNIWFQQGTISSPEYASLSNPGVSYIMGECVFMYLEPVESIHKFHRAVRRFFRKMPA